MVYIVVAGSNLHIKVHHTASNEYLNTRIVVPCVYGQKQNTLDDDVHKST